MKESEFQKQVIDLARLRGWRVAHFKPAMMRGRWVTPVQADGGGFPDLVLVRPPRVIFAELKQDKSYPSPAQRAWLEMLALCSGVESAVWRPRDLDVIASVLR